MTECHTNPARSNYDIPSSDTDNRYFRTAMTRLLEAIRYTKGELFLSVGGLYLRTRSKSRTIETPVAELLPIMGMGYETVDEIGRRFIATWNACEDVPDNELSPGTVAELREALQEVVSVVSTLLQHDRDRGNYLPEGTRTWATGSLRYAQEVLTGTPVG